MSADLGSEKNTERAQPWFKNWAALRKLETLAFASMFIAVPLFAFKVVNQATTSMVVTNTSVDLQHDLRRAEEIARTYAMKTKITTQEINGNVPASYSVEAGGKITEVVRVPHGVNVVGEVRFDEQGSPEKPATFIVSRGNVSIVVNVDAKGIVQTP